MLKQLNLEIRGYFMLNLPAETKKTILETFLFIEKLNVDLVNIQIAYPYPNTSFRKLAEKKYKLKYNKWDNWEYSDGDDVVFLQNNLTEEYILTYYNKIIKNNFLNLKFIINWMKRIKSFHDFKYSFYQFLNLISNNK
jgi:radical SAM superfamily enzyme YgiQ (UPF0313 family)